MLQASWPAPRLCCPNKPTRFYDLAANLIGEYDQDGNILQETIWLNGQPVAMFKGGDWTNLDSLHYIWTDALGTPREISHANTQQIVWRWTNNDPFGSNKAQSIRGFEYNLRFAGQVYDKETGLHYNHFRDYNPKTGRYIQSDPIGLNGGINTYAYAYVGNNPLNFVDPLGLYVTSPISDFYKNYRDMRDANTIGADKYFHCKANCEASKRGTFGEAMAVCISDSREFFDQRWPKNDPAAASAADQIANHHGRNSIKNNPKNSCEEICSLFRPKSLPKKY
jgi:RHS repeat-associated protein